MNSSFDATESTRLGRYCNDSPFPNTKIKFVKDCGYKLCLFATRDINPMEEIVYDYGDSNLWWREKVRVFRYSRERNTTGFNKKKIRRDSEMRFKLKHT